MTKPRDDSPFPISLDQPDVQVSRNRVAIWLDVSPDTVRRIEDGPEWVYITERLERSSAHGWIRWLLRKQEEQRAALAAAQAALPARAEAPAPKRRGRPPGSTNKKLASETVKRGPGRKVQAAAPPGAGPAPPIKRGRGRPRKYPLPQQAAE